MVSYRGTNLSGHYTWFYLKCISPALGSFKKKKTNKNPEGFFLFVCCNFFCNVVWVLLFANFKILKVSPFIKYHLLVVSFSVEEPIQR